MYCEKEFRYPSILKRHLKLKNMCSKQVDQIILTTNRVSLTTNQVSPTTNQISPSTNRISLISDQKNTIPIRLFLAN